ATRRLAKHLKPRKSPRQERSAAMCEAIRGAAARVLARDGAARFNTNRVADAAGISIGSLYQYYPNKTALLLDLYEREVYATWAAISAELFSDDGSPRERFARAIAHFFRIESDGAPLRLLLADAAVAVSETDEFAVRELQIAEATQRFLRESLRDRGRRRDLTFEAEFMLVTVASISEHLVRDRVGAAELARWADVVATMLSDRLGLR
ncbi:MAG TPA: TetR/AcrR family transcriptional regulator, partial [Pseudomonadales bacterium]|nr:TetR/AcrR family transcriptional regulator [Pseudomonadales bacterium]